MGQRVVWLWSSLVRTRHSPTSAVFLSPRIRRDSEVCRGQDENPRAKRTSKAGSTGGMTAKDAVPTIISSRRSHSFQELTRPACTRSQFVMTCALQGSDRHVFSSSIQQDRADVRAAKPHATSRVLAVKITSFPRVDLKSLILGFLIWGSHDMACFFLWWCVSPNFSKSDW